MKYFLSFIAVILCIAQGSQDPKRITRTLSMDDALILREIGAVVVAKDNSLIVDIILANNDQQPTDIKKDDIILMANGKKVKTISDLRALYESATAGNEIKIGLKRGEHLQIAAFVKKSEQELNKDGGHGGMVFKMEKKEGEEMLPALGLSFGTKKNTVVISSVLPTAEKNFRSVTPKEGDVIVSINGTRVGNAEAFVEAYDNVNEGESVTIVLSRSGKEMKETFKKPKPMGRMIMTR
jgi:S1-C subfamily serine protease